MRAIILKKYVDKIIKKDRMDLPVVLYKRLNIRSDINTKIPTTT